MNLWMELVRPVHAPSRAAPPKSATSMPKTAHVVVAEIWENSAALQVHFAVAEPSQFVRRSAAMTDGVAEMRLFESTELPQHPLW